MKEIIFFGDSLTAGYGLAHADRDAVPGRIASKIEALQLPYLVVNAGISGDTSVSAYPRLAKLLHPDIALFILELGANDFLRGHEPEVLLSYLSRMIEDVQSAAPRAKILLLGIEMPSWVPFAYGSRYAHIYSNLANRFTINFVPSFLEPIKGQRAYHLPDGLHPLASGYEKIAEYLWPRILPLLE